MLTKKYKSSIDGIYSKFKLGSNWIHIQTKINFSPFHSSLLLLFKSFPKCVPQHVTREMVKITISVHMDRGSEKVWTILGKILPNLPLARTLRLNSWIAPTRPMFLTVVISSQQATSRSWIKRIRDRGEWTQHRKSDVLYRCFLVRKIRRLKMKRNHLLFFWQ